MIRLERTTSESPVFRQLTSLLDKELKAIYGATQDEFDIYNIVDNIGTVVLAFWDNEPAGCGCFKRFGNHEAELKRMFVVNHFRGKGIGKALVAELENWAAELNYLSLVLETGTIQNEAVELYKKCGYDVISNFEPYIGNELSICFRKILPVE